MKKTLIALALGGTLAAPAAWAQTTTLEQRMQLLEQRLLAAETRAQKAESEIRQLKQTQQPVSQAAPPDTPAIAVVSATPSEESKNNVAAPTLKLSGFGDLKLYGDVEFNMDAESRKGSLISDRDNDNEKWDINGRILLGIDGYRNLNNGHFAGFTAQPLADMTGSMNLDDAAFFFGRENDWKIKIGRFEAFDMFPLNQDTFVEHSGDTANDLYDDGHGYIYMMKEARGRSDSGGNFLLSKQLDNWYFELNTLIENGSSLFVDSTYHGRELVNDKNVVYLRPVISWTQDALSLSAAMESNVVNNAYGYYDQQGKWVDQSQRTGYGAVMTWNGLKNDPENGVVLNLSTAYLDASGEKDFSTGINALWKRFELGYIYAHNKIEQFDQHSLVGCEDDCWITDTGTYDIHTLHASYQIPNIMDMKNFNIYLGTYWSWLNEKGGNEEAQDRYGARVRFKYFF